MKEEEIFYIVSKFGGPRTNTADLATFQSWIFSSIFFLIFENRLGVNGLIGNLECMNKPKKWSKLRFSLISDQNDPILHQNAFLVCPVNPLLPTGLI